MERIAFIINETFLYWNTIILAFGVLAALCTFLCFYLQRRNQGISAAVLLPVAMVLSLIFARLVHWYCCANAYQSMEAALTNFSGGGYALMGVFAGCALAACLLRLLGIVRNLPFTFDCMALGGAMGIAVGRLACLYTAADRGQLLDPSIPFPWAYSVTNAVTGAVEWRLATFMLQAMVTGLIFLVILVFHLSARKGRRDGDTACLFLCMYGASQVVLDSTRYDSLFLRSNGFISIVQILGAVALVGTVIYFSVRMVKGRGFHKWYIGLWLLYAACVGGAGFMEYWVQRHGDQAVFSYSVMSACLLTIVLLTCWIRTLGEKKKRGRFLVENAKK